MLLLKVVSCALWIFGLWNCLVPLVVSSTHLHHHPLPCCSLEYKSWVSISTLMALGKTRLADTTLDWPTLLSCRFDCNGVGTVLWPLPSATEKTLVALSMLMLPLHAKASKACRLINRPLCGCRCPEACTHRMHTLIGMRGREHASGVVNLIHLSTDTSNALRRNSPVKGLLQTLPSCGLWSLMLWLFAVGLSCHLLVLDGCVSWTPCLLLCLRVSWRLFRTVGIASSLMVLAFGSLVLTSVLLRGVLFLLPRFQANGLLPATVFCVRGVLPGLVQTAFRSELYALCVVLHHASLGGFRVKIFSDCLGVVNKFNLLTRGMVKLKQNTNNADLWMWALQAVDVLGLHNIQLQKTPAHRTVASATTRYEAWLFWHNATADLAAKFANLDRGSTFWDNWQQHAADVMAAQEMHQQAWNLHLQVAQMSVKTEQALTLDEVEVLPPKPTRQFEMEFDVSRWTGGLPPEFANEYGPGMAQRVALWWKARTQAGGQTVKWVSFIHLYIDYQLTYGCAGPLQSKTSWLDCQLRPYLDANRYPFLKRVKWFRRCMKQFWRYSQQRIGLAQCRCESEILQSHVAAASITWDAATLSLVEAWLAENCVGPISRGTKMVQALPVAKALPGMCLTQLASQDAAVGAPCA